MKVCTAEGNRRAPPTRWVLPALLALAAAPGAFPQPAVRPSVALDEGGKLVYTADRDGNTIPDFSNCGYGGGGVALPDVPVKETLSPGEGDDTARIQAALDRLARLPLNGAGFRGALLLRRGKYRVGDTLRMKAGGVVLRGEGPEETGTVIIATGATKRPLIQVSGAGKPVEVPGSRRQIADAYVPVGARSFRVEGGASFKPGDRVIVHRPCTQAWVHALGMDRLPPRADGGPVVQWHEGSEVLGFDRVVTAVKGDRVELDAPLTCALDREFGGGSISRYTAPGRIARVGVERLRCISDYRSPTDEDHGWNAVELRAVENAFVRDVTAVHFGNAAVQVEAGAKWVTVQDCVCLDPVSQLIGSRRYSFHLNGGQLTLWQRCRARNGRHDFVTGGRVAGPSVFLDCTAEQAHSNAGPHMRWAVGILYDGVQTDGALDVANRGNLGSGHGWAGANHVLWNCRARSIVCERPPTANNWAIGCITDKRQGDATWESPGQPVQPTSLYRAQLAQRLKAVKTD